ncbi:unnamed protein product, partial [Clonostachys solani]
PRALGQTAKRVEIIKLGHESPVYHLYTASPRGQHRHPCGQSERTKGVKDIHSSTRVDSVASVGNQEKVEYYRNDSPADSC